MQVCDGGNGIYVHFQASRYGIIMQPDGLTGW